MFDFRQHKHAPVASNPCRCVLSLRLTLSWTQAAKPAAKKAKAEDDSAAQGSSTVFVKNLPWSASDEDLANFFADCGEVAEVRIGAFCHFFLQLIRRLDA
jgi:RNA recognition motif. (a.k.a. RRM, RBD, or RNP domain)